MILSLGQQIRMFRLRRGLTQQDLATKADVTTGIVSQWEGDKAQPNLSSLTRLAAALDCWVLVDNQGALLVEPGSPTGRDDDRARGRPS
jgi:transcriptional regulator with XRE-family HTH domain